MRSTGSIPETFLFSARSSAAGNADLADAEIAAQMANTRVLGLWDIKRAIMMKKTTNQPVTDRYADVLPVLEEYDESQDDNKSMQIM